MRPSSGLDCHNEATPPLPKRSWPDRVSTFPPGPDAAIERVPVADQVSRRFVTGDHEQDAIRKEFIFGQPVSLLFSLNQRAQQITAGLARSSATLSRK